MPDHTLFYYIDPDGNEVLINDHVNVFFLEEDGFGLEGAEPISERVAYEHGTRHVGMYLPDRTILIRIGILAETDTDWRAKDDLLCRQLSPFIDEAETGTLKRVNADGTERYIDALLIGYNKSSADREGPVYGERVLKFWCHDPFFYDPDEHEVNKAQGSSGGFEFPFTFSLTFAETNLNTHSAIDNLGDVRSFPEIIIYGPLKNPDVENETLGYHIGVTKTLIAGETITINMAEGECDFYNGATTVSIMELLVAGSTFWSLRRGENTVHFTAQDVQNGGIILQWYNRYQSA